MMWRIHIYGQMSGVTIVMTLKDHQMNIPTLPDFIPQNDAKGKPDKNEIIKQKRTRFSNS